MLAWRCSVTMDRLLWNTKGNIRLGTTLKKNVARRMQGSFVGRESPKRDIPSSSHHTWMDSKCGLGKSYFVFGGLNKEYAGFGGKACLLFGFRHRFGFRHVC